MEWYYIAAIISAAFCFVAFLVQTICLFRLGAPKDLSEKSGSVSGGVLYSCTVAMLPTNKESAYKHLPTYTAGILFHIGICFTLLYFIWMVIAMFAGISASEIEQISAVNIIGKILTAILAISSICGIAILLKRFFKKELRYLSSPDDYISNILTTAAQIVTFCYIYNVIFFDYSADCFAIPYFLILSLLLLWMPFGKTKHVLYFFFARYHLGYFYGRRGSWPVKTKE